MATRNPFYSTTAFENMMRQFFGENPNASLARRGLSGLTGGGAGVFPPVNLYDDGETFLLRAEMPGVDREDLDVSSKGRELIIRGERTIEAAEQSANYHRRERDAGTFRRVFTLPEEIDHDKVAANYNLGVLEVILPRSPQTRPRQIDIG